MKRCKTNLVSKASAVNEIKFFELMIKPQNILREKGHFVALSSLSKISAAEGL